MIEFTVRDSYGDRRGARLCKKDSNEVRKIWYYWQGSMIDNKIEYKFIEEAKAAIMEMYSASEWDLQYCWVYREAFNVKISDLNKLNNFIGKFCGCIAHFTQIDLLTAHVVISFSTQDACEIFKLNHGKKYTPVRDVYVEQDNLYQKKNMA